MGLSRAAPSVVAVTEMVGWLPDRVLEVVVSEGLSPLLSHFRWKV